MNQNVRLKVNGTDHELDIPARRLLVDCIRYDIGLTGTKESCSVGVCGACAVLVDGEMYASCITLAASVDGAEITTIEGIAEDGNLHTIQQAFIDHGGFQCGICTPGQVMGTYPLSPKTSQLARTDKNHVKIFNLAEHLKCQNQTQLQSLTLSQVDTLPPKSFESDY